jgi:hypothetical protein
MLVAICKLLGPCVTMWQEKIVQEEMMPAKKKAKKKKH